jgi:hypothetical protein
MTKLKLVLVMAAAATMFAGCFESSDESESAKPAAYVAMGDALTAGFQNNGLVVDFQEGSYPVLIAKQMGIEDFQYATVDTPGIGRDKGPNGEATIPYFIKGDSITTRLLGKPSSELLSNRTLNRPYDNLGVPGATSTDVLNAYDSTTSSLNPNPFFNMVLRGSLMSNTTMLRQAISRKPEVISLWIGSSDILGGVVAGTVIPGTTIVPASFFEANLTKILDTLIAETSAEIFLANIPSITSIPFVTTVPRWVFNPKTFQPAVDTNFLLLTKEADVKYILLPALKLLATGVGVPKEVGGKGDSLPATMTLTATEAATAEATIAGYNAAIAKKATENPDRVSLVDVNDLLKRLTNNEIAGLSAKFVLLDKEKTAFGLDGIHPNAKGYKQVANLFITRMNAVLNKTYPTVE